MEKRSIIFFILLEVFARVYYHFHPDSYTNKLFEDVYILPEYKSEYIYIHLLKNEPIFKRNNILIRRDSDVPETAPPNTYRILAYGDSVTLGAFINVDETYPNQLEKNLIKVVIVPI